MLLDWTLIHAAAFLTVVVVTIIQWALHPEQPLAESGDVPAWVGGVAALAVVYIPASVSSGASIGQRLVWLEPRATDGTQPARWRLLVRATAVAGLLALELCVIPAVAGLFPLMAIISIIMLIVSPQALSPRLAGLVIADAREHTTT